MGNRLALCPICGSEFAPQAANAKYCSIECKIKGQRQRRKEWERESGYLEKQRQKMQDYRDKVAANEKAAQAAAQKNAAANLKRQETRRRNDKLAQLLQAAELGDAAARRTLAAREGGNTSPEYWEAFKESLLQWGADQTRREEITVNGISINSPDFGLAVSLSIEELGSIATATRLRKESEK